MYYFDLFIVLFFIKNKSSGHETLFTNTWRMGMHMHHKLKIEQKYK